MEMASSRASSSFSERCNSASFLIGAPRSNGERALHAGKAARAASTAAFTSSSVASATAFFVSYVLGKESSVSTGLPFATRSPVCGEKSSNVPLSLAGTSLLLMSSCVSITSVMLCSWNCKTKKHSHLEQRIAYISQIARASVMSTGVYTRSTG